MRTALDVMNDLNLSISTLEWAAIYARSAPDVDPDCWAHNQAAIRNKIQRCRDFLDAIESKLKPQEVRDAA